MICSGCGAEIEEGSSKCEYCGQAVSSQDSANNAPLTKSEKKQAYKNAKIDPIRFIIGALLTFIIGKYGLFAGGIFGSICYSKDKFSQSKGWVMGVLIGFLVQLLFALVLINLK